MNSSQKKVAVYPGSFYPIHLGHIDIIQRISPLYCSSISQKVLIPICFANSIVD